MGGGRAGGGDGGHAQNERRDKYVLETYPYIELCPLYAHLRQNPNLYDKYYFQNVIL